MFEYNREKVAYRIKLLRKKLRMTLKEFSEYLGIPVSSINSWERGVSIPRPHYLKKLATKNNVSERWILYGDVDDYVQDVFDYLDLSSKVKEDQCFQIVDTLKSSNFKVGDYNKFEETARLIIDNYDDLILDEEDTFIPYIKPERIATEFKFLKNTEIQQVYLTLLNDLLLEENKSKNGQSILFLLDALSRMNDSTKPLLKRVLRDINWLVTNNILLLDKNVQSEEAKYGGISDSKNYDSMEERTWEETEKEMNQIINDIVSRLKSIVELNYEELKSSDRKSIF